MEKLVGPTLVFVAAAAVAPATLAWRNLPAAFLIAACFIPVCTTYASSTYPMAPSVEVIAWATAWFPLAACCCAAAGQLIDLAGLLVASFHAGEILLR